MEGQNKDINLSALGNFKKDYDKVLGILRDEDNRQRNNTLTWIIKPFGRALFNYSPFSPSNKNTLVTKLTSSSLLQNATFSTALIFYVNEFNEQINTGFLILSILLYVFSVVVNFKRQITLYDEYFDISAFRNLEKIIHTKLVSKYVEAAPFTFSALYDYLRDLLVSSKEHINQMLIEKLDSEKQNLELRNELEKTRVIVNEMRKSLNNQIDLQSHLNQTLLRVISGDFNKDDLMIVCKYSLFREEDNYLILDAGHGLTSTPKRIDLDGLKEHQKDWAVICAYHDEEEEVYEDISHNRKIVSKRFKMRDGTVYIYSYHYDIYKEEEYGIIKTEEAVKTLYTLISYWHFKHTIKEDETLDSRKKAN
jgi:hypothetical protein